MDEFINYLLQVSILLILLYLPVPVTPAGSFMRTAFCRKFQLRDQPVRFNWMLLYWLGAGFMLIRNLWVIARNIRLSHRSER
jgi:hypothetical protein